MAKYKPFRTDLSNPAEFYKGKKDGKGRITHQYRLEGNLASYNAPSPGGKRAKTIDFDFYRDIVNLMASRPLEPSKEWSAYARQIARKNGLSYSWLSKKGIPPGWKNREAERQTFYDSLMRIGEKYNLSLNQITKKMEALSYVAADINKRLPRELMTDITALQSIVGIEIPKKEARKASANYFADRPYVDMIRFNRRIPTQDRTILGRWERVARRAEQEIRGRMDEGKLPAKAAQGWLEQVPVIGGMYSKIEKNVEPQNRKAALEKASSMIFLARQGGEQGRRGRRAAGKMLEKIEAETKGKQGPPQYTPFTRKLTEGLGEQPEKESIDWALSKVKRYRWKDKHRGMGGDWKEAPHLEIALEREAAESKGKATAGIEETRLLGIKGGTHYRAKSVIYGDVLKLQRQFNELAKKKKTRRKR